MSDDDIQALLETMRWTGSSSNSQPWQFVAVRDQAAKDALAQATQYTGWIAQAPLILVVLTAGSIPTRTRTTSAEWTSASCSRRKRLDSERDRHFLE